MIEVLKEPRNDGKTVVAPPFSRAIKAYGEEREEMRSSEKATKASSKIKKREMSVWVLWEGF